MGYYCTAFSLNAQEIKVKCSRKHNIMALGVGGRDREGMQQHVFGRGSEVSLEWSRTVIQARKGKWRQQAGTSTKVLTAATGLLSPY